MRLAPLLRAALAGGAVLSPLAAQAPRAASPLDPTAWGVVDDAPGTARVTVRAGVPFLVNDRGTFRADIYLPPGPARGAARPVVVFLNGIGAGPPGERVREWAIYRSWPRLVAAHGMVGVSMDNDEGDLQAGLHALLRFLRERAGEYGLDPARVGVYAASANVTQATRFLLGDPAPAGVRAAALFYGSVPPRDARLRADLPVLFIVAAGDAPRMQPALDSLWQRVTASGAPWTLTFASDLPHAFDAFDEREPSRRLVRQAIGFWKAQLEPLPDAGPPSDARAVVAALYGSDRARAAELLGRYTAAHPRDAVAWREYGRALGDLRRLDGADTAYQRAVALDSTSAGAHTGLGIVRASQRRWLEAEGLLARGIALGHENSFTVGQLAWVQLNLGKPAESARHYERALALGIPPGRATRGVALYNLACAYARLGRIDEAFGALDRAVAEGMRERRTFETDPDLAPLRADARFARLLDGLARTG